MCCLDEHEIMLGRRRAAGWQTELSALKCDLIPGVRMGDDGRITSCISKEASTL